MIDNINSSSGLEEKLNVVQYVKGRLKYLHSIKAHRFPAYWSFRNQYAQIDVPEYTEDGFTNYSMNTWFAIVSAKTAEIFAGTPQYDFVWLDENGRRYKRHMEKFWEWVWKQSNTDKAITEIITDSNKYGTWFWIEKYIIKKREVKSPIFWEDWVIDFKTETITEYKWCQLVPLSWENVYLNGKDIDSATEAIVITHWDKDEFYSAFTAPFFDINKYVIHKGKIYYTTRWTSELFMPDGTSRDSTSIDDSNTISVIEYWNKYKDEYVVIAGDAHINEFQWKVMPMPYPHKEIPLVVYTDHIVDNDIYGRGEYDITNKSRQLKDDSRSLMIETIKMQGGIITIAPSSDFDETVERIWLKQFARIDKNDLWFFQPSINVSSLELLEKKIDEDIIIETGVDFRLQLFWPRETAERTKWRIDASRKRINSNVRNNAYSFYSRLANLRLENIRTNYKGQNDIIPIKGYDITSSWVQQNLGWDYGIMQLTDKMLSGNIMLVPVIDSIYGDTSHVQRQKYMEFLQLAMNMKKADGQPLFDPALLIEAGRWIIDDVVDLDKLLGANGWTQAEVERLLKARWLPSMDAANPQWQNQWPSPYQQSGKPILLGSSPTENTPQ